MCPPVRLIAWLSGSVAHKVGAETPRRRRHVLGVAAQTARCSNAMRAINSSPTRGHLVVARKLGLVKGGDRARRLRPQPARHHWESRPPLFSRAGRCVTARHKLSGGPNSRDSAARASGTDTLDSTPTQQYCCVVIPSYVAGALPAGIHPADWPEVEGRFGMNAWRAWLLAGLREALRELARVGCPAAYLDGSFVTEKPSPGDYDLCWEHSTVDLSLIDPIFLDVAPPRAAQRAKYRGDLLPNVQEAGSRMLFVDFFQIDKASGAPKGIIALDPGKVP